MTKVTAEITFMHGALFPAQVVMPIEYEVSHWWDAMTTLFNTPEWHAAQDALGIPQNIVSIKFTFSDGQ